MVKKRMHKASFFIILAVLMAGLPGFSIAATAEVEFGPPQTIQMQGQGLNLGKVHIHDFDGDGLNDIMENVGGKLRVYFQGGEEPFEQAKSIDTGSQPGPVAVADFDEDGILDFVAGSKGYRSGSGQPPWGNVCGTDYNANNRIPVFMGNGNGSFTHSTCLEMEYYTGWTDQYITGAVCADFNNDDHADVAISRTGNYGGKYIATFMGNGDGTFQDVVITDVPRPYGIAEGDFDHDGFLDLIVSNYYSTGFYSGDGNGGFSYTSGLHPISLSRPISGDLTGDGINDVVIYHMYHGTVDVYVAQGDGTFVHSQVIELYADDVSIADVNGDGHQDIVALAGTVHIYYGDSTGSFAEAPQVENFEGAKQLVRLGAGDLNNDTAVDLFVTDRNYADEAVGFLRVQVKDSVTQDRVKVPKAVYKESKGKLIVKAMTDDPAAVLTAETANGASFVMEKFVKVNKKGFYIYKQVVRHTDNPGASITVMSTSGGSKTKPVTYR